jgi:signal transduction histidine kinase
MLTVRNWPIRIKITAILVVPLLAVGSLLAVIVHNAQRDATAAKDVQALSAYAEVAGDAVDALQRERIFTAVALSGRRSVTSPQLIAIRRQTDAAMAKAIPAGQGLALAKHNKVVAANVAGFATATQSLAQLRAAVDSRAVPADQADQAYAGAAGALLQVSSAMYPLSAGNRVGARANATLAYLLAKEAVADEGAFIAGALARRTYRPGDFRRLITLVGAQEQAVASFISIAANGEETYFLAAAGSQANLDMNALQENLLSTGDIVSELPVTAEAWVSAVTGWLSGLHTAEVQINRGLGGTASDQAADATRTVRITILFAVLAMLLTVVLSLLIARSMVRPLRAMRAAALDTAQRGLVDVVRQLRTGQPANPDPAPIPVLSTDEVGEVASAFNAVHSVAVQVAMEQAASRRATAETFLNIARRSQALIHRQLQLIDEMERGTTEPSELDELFRLDHLATRMRRHAEDLIVLSGATPARGWSRPVGIRDVVRGAVAEVEDYTRVAMRALQEGELIGPAVGDVIHLLAELLENATSFSPPTTWVNVYGQHVANGYAIEVEDAGLGMDDARRDQLNAQLDDPTPNETQTTERLGLFVVGRLARRHGIDVHLRRSPYGGTTAIVLLPNALLQGGLIASGEPAGGRPSLPPGMSAGVPAQSGYPGDPALRAGPSITGPAGMSAASIGAGPAAPMAPRVPAPRRPDPMDGPPPMAPGAEPVLAPGGAHDWFGTPDPGTVPAEPPPPAPPAPPVRVAALLARTAREDDTGTHAARPDPLGDTGTHPRHATPPAAAGPGAAAGTPGAAAPTRPDHPATAPPGGDPTDRPGRPGPAQPAGAGPGGRGSEPGSYGRADPAQPAGSGPAGRGPEPGSYGRGPTGPGQLPAAGAGPTNRAPAGPGSTGTGTAADPQRPGTAGERPPAGANGAGRSSGQGLYGSGYPPQSGNGRTSGPLPPPGARPAARPHAATGNPEDLSWFGDQAGRPEPLAGPAESDRPFRPERAAQPERPADRPAQPVHPAESDRPFRPERAAQPERPAQPVHPAESDRPFRPDRAAQPERPAQPMYPAESDRPFRPERPAQPMRPATPAVPEQFGRTPAAGPKPPLPQPWPPTPPSTLPPPPTPTVVPAQSGPKSSAPPAPPKITGYTENGLPRRSRKAASDDAGGKGPQVSLRAPEETRALFAQYQSGLTMGRERAGSQGGPDNDAHSGQEQE